MKKPTWKDQFSGSYGEEVVEASRMKLPEGFTLVVHHYIGYPKTQWFLSIFRDVVERHPLGSAQLREAKKEALAYARNLFKNVLDALEA